MVVLARHGALVSQELCVWYRICQGCGTVGVLLLESCCKVCHRWEAGWFVLSPWLPDGL